MDAKREQAVVGIFVLVASGVLLATVFALSGALGGSGNLFHASFKFAGGLEPGATVRYGGIKAGRIEQLRVDPKDPQKIEITFHVDTAIPVKTDSLAKISSLGALGDNYLELTTGTAGAPRAASGSVLTSSEYVSFADLTVQLSALGPDAQKLIGELNKRAQELGETVTRVNEVLNEANRANLAGTLGNVRGMIEENRAHVKSTVANVNASSAKLPPLMDDFKQSVAKADKALKQIDEMLGENRPDVRASIQDLRKALADADTVIRRLDTTLMVNAENIDEMLENMRLTTENLKQFTDEIRARPSTLLRSSTPADHKHEKDKKP